MVSFTIRKLAGPLAFGPAGIKVVGRTRVRSMPIEYKIDASQQTVQITCHGEVTAQDIFQVRGRLQSDPRFHTDFSALIETSGLARFGVSWDLLNGLRHEDPFSGKSRRAVVAPASLAFGLARMYQGLRRDPNFAVFRTVDEAREWIQFGNHRDQPGG